MVSILKIIVTKTMLYFFRVTNDFSAIVLLRAQDYAESTYVFFQVIVQSPKVIVMVQSIIAQFLTQLDSSMN